MLDISMLDESFSSMKCEPALLLDFMNKNMYDPLCTINPFL